MFGFPPIVKGLFKAANESLVQLRMEIQNSRFGPIKKVYNSSIFGDIIINFIGTILFEFRGKTYEALEPTELIFGVNPELDKRIALKSILDYSAKVLDRE